MTTSCAAETVHGACDASYRWDRWPRWGWENAIGCALTHGENSRAD